MGIPYQKENIKPVQGLQTRKALDSFYKEEAVSCDSLYFDITGAVTKRKGGEKYNTTPLGSPLLGIYDFKFNQNTEERLLLAAGDELFIGNAGNPISIFSGLTPTDFYDFVTYSNFAWIVNGFDPLLKYDGTDVTQGSIDPPPSGFILSPDNQGSNLPVGTYRVAITFVGESESNPTPIEEITLAGLDDEIDITNIPISSDAQVTARNIYVTDVNGGILLLNQTINDNVTTTATITDVVFGESLQFDHNPAPIGLQGLEVHKDRLFGFIGDQVYFTKDFEPWYWPQGIGAAETNFTFLVGNSSPITGIKSFFDFLLIFKSDDIYILSGDSEFNFRVDRLKSDERVGAVSNRAIDVVGNYCYFIGINSLYRTNGITTEDVGESLGEFFDQNSSNSVLRVNKIFNKNACSVYFKELNVWLVFLATGGSELNNSCFCMDTNSVSMDPAGRKVHANWAPWSGFIATQSVANVVENGFDAWFRGDDLGFVFRQERLDGDGSNITSVSTGSGAVMSSEWDVAMWDVAMWDFTGSPAIVLVDTTQSWTNDLYSGLRVNICSGTGEGQERRIVSNNSDTLIVSPAWDIFLDDTSEYTIGGIPFHYEHAWSYYGNKDLSKRWRYATPTIEAGGAFDVTLTYGFDFKSFLALSYDVPTSTSGASLWDQAMWDESSWDGVSLQNETFSVGSSRIHQASNFRIENKKAAQPLKYLGVIKRYQLKGMRKNRC